MSRRVPLDEDGHPEPNRECTNPLCPGAEWLDSDVTMDAGQLRVLMDGLDLRPALTAWREAIDKPEDPVFGRLWPEPTPNVTAAFAVLEQVIRDNDLIDVPVRWYSREIPATRIDPPEEDRPECPVCDHGGDSI